MRPKWRTVHVRQATLALGIGCLPLKACLYSVYVLGMDVLKGLRIATAQGEFHLQLRVVNLITRGHLHHTAFRLPNPHQVSRVQ